jgi:NADPH-dependent FMN reductase
MAELLPAYAEADLVLISTPVYHFGMTAILKAFFERTLPLSFPYMIKKGPLYTHPWRREPNESRRCGVFATCGFPDADNFRPLRAHFEKLLGERLEFEFFCPEGELLKVPALRALAAPRLTALREAGATFARTGALPAGVEAGVAAPMTEIESFARMANASWSVPGEEPPTEAAFAGLEPYAPTRSPSSGVLVARGTEDGQTSALPRRMTGTFSSDAEPGEGKIAQSAERRPSFMALALLPWYFGWFLGGRSFFLGQALPLVLSLAFLAYRERRREATWLERGTPLAFAYLAALALSSPAAFAAHWNAFCNALIALIWGLSLLYGRPLTSDYSKAGYSRAVVSGVIFRRVNVGLTALWAVLFGLSAAVGLAVPGNDQGRVAIAAGLFQIPAGVITVWFPRWYPGHLAAREGQKALLSLSRRA